MYKTTTFRQLTALDAVARLASISRAAQELHLTQPTISLQLRLLEEAAGAPLTQRAGRGIVLTPAGEVLAHYAAQMLRLWRNAVDDIAAQQGLFTGTLSVGAVITAEYLLPPLLVAFARQRPEVKIKLNLSSREEVVRMLVKREVDLAIMGRPPMDIRTDSEKFAKHPMAFIAAPHHPLMAKKKLTLRDLAEENILLRERGSGSYNTVERLFKKAQVPFSSDSELSSNEAIKQLVAAGLGVGFLSLHACAQEFQDGRIALLPLAGNPIQHDWYILQLSTARLSAVGAAFRSFVVSHGQANIDQQLKDFATAKKPVREGKERRQRQSKPAIDKEAHPKGS